MDSAASMSIIVLFHNNKHFTKCIYSIINQFMMPDDEIIIINDHSSDKYNNELNALLSYKYIRIFNSIEKTGNRSYNRNLGAKYANNPILVFVDGDVYFPKPVLKDMKDALVLRNAIASFGNVYGHQYDEITINNLLGFDYLSCLFNENEWKKLLNIPFMVDFRSKKDPALLSGEWVWNYFYTSYCMISKDAFYQAGMFDESFSEWGAEDVDLGFRLSKQGTLEYMEKLIAFHIPHPKNRMKNQISNLKNMYYMLYKYQSVEFELKIAYDKSPALFCALKEFLLHQRNLTVESQGIPEHSGIVHYDIVSRNSPNGRIQFIDDKGNLHNMELLGLALPFSNNAFEQAYIPYEIFLYPYTLIPRIFQEFLRISQNVYIKKCVLAERLKWNMSVINAFNRNSPFRDLFYVSKTLQDFRLYDTGKMLEIKTVFDFTKYGGGLLNEL